MLLATLLIVSLGAGLWNQSRPTTQIDTSYTARWSNDRDARPSFHEQVVNPEIELTASGVEALEEIILSLRPVRNPLRIGWEHLRYWANERLFPVKIYLESESGPRLVYYQRGRFVFLRHAQHRNDVVLTGTTLPADLEAKLKPFVIGLRPEDPWTSGVVEQTPTPDSS
jgi:hypothetical protein